MKKILLSLFLGVFVSFTFSYTLTSVDHKLAEDFYNKLVSIQQKKGDAYADRIIEVLTIFKEKNKTKNQRLYYILGEVLNKFDVGQKNTETVNEISMEDNSNEIEVSETIQKVLDLVNQERKKLGLSQLSLNTKLMKSAQGHADYMKQSGDFAHTTKDGVSMVDRIEAVGYDFGYIGENIAWGQRTPEEVMNAWMNSPGHKANILNQNFTEIGIGYAEPYWVQNFGKPLH